MAGREKFWKGEARSHQAGFAAAWQHKKGGPEGPPRCSTRQNYFLPEKKPDYCNNNDVIGAVVAPI